MDKFKVKGETYHMPECWDDVDIKTYKKIIDTFNRSKDKGDTSIIIDVISELTGMPNKDIYYLDVDTFNAMASTLNFVGTDIPDRDVEFITINGEKYGFKNQYEKLNVGEMISIEQMIKNSDNVSIEVDKVIAVIMRKVNDDGTLADFNSDLVDEYIKLIQDIKITDVYKLCIFFFDIVRIYINNSMASSNQ